MEIRTRAEIRAGELTREMEKAEPGGVGGGSKVAGGDIRYSKQQILQREFGISGY